MNNLINKNEALKAISNDGGIQYPRWWYIEQIRKLHPEPDVISRQAVLNIIKDRKKYWHDERATAALNDIIFEIEHGGGNGRTDELVD